MPNVVVVNFFYGLEHSLCPTSQFRQAHHVSSVCDGYLLAGSAVVVTLATLYLCWWVYGLEIERLRLSRRWKPFRFQSKDETLMMVSSRGE